MVSGVALMDFAAPPKFLGAWIIPAKYHAEYRSWRAKNPEATRFEVDSWMIDHYAIFKPAPATT